MLMKCGGKAAKKQLCSHAFNTRIANNRDVNDEECVATRDRDLLLNKLI